MSTTYIEQVSIPTGRCQPWCETHEIDTSETHIYGGVPHDHHYSEPIVVGEQITVQLRLFEPANDPAGSAAHIDITSEQPTFDGDVPIATSRRIAEAIIELCARAEPVHSRVTVESTRIVVRGNAVAGVD
ncbi:MAG: hypothetical protein H0V07_13985 [Propionibacteriales bacterium]|nr:hypothetical protein [Propionibacteriales bacterium]